MPFLTPFLLPRVNYWEQRSWHYFKSLELTFVSLIQQTCKKFPSYYKYLFFINTEQWTKWGPGSIEACRMGKKRRQEHTGALELSVWWWVTEVDWPAIGRSYKIQRWLICFVSSTSVILRLQVDKILHTSIKIHTCDHSPFPTRAILKAQNPSSEGEIKGPWKDHGTIVKYYTINLPPQVNLQSLTKGAMYWEKRNNQNIELDNNQNFDYWILTLNWYCFQEAQNISVAFHQAEGFGDWND